jgi:hypothetical protein
MADYTVIGTNPQGGIIIEQNGVRSTVPPNWVKANPPVSQNKNITGTPSESSLTPTQSTNPFAPNYQQSTPQQAFQNLVESTPQPQSKALPSQTLSDSYNPSTGGGERIVINAPTSSGGTIPITLSEGVTQKVGGIEGLKNIMYTYHLQQQSQDIVNMAVRNAAIGSRIDVMRTPEEMLKIQAEDAMIAERASRIETFAYYGMNAPRTAMIGLGASMALAAGVPIENLRSQEFEMRKQFVREHLESPVLRTGKELFDIGSFMVFASPKTYSVAMNAIKNSAYAQYILPAIKPIVIGTSAFIATKGAFESVGAGIDIATKEPNLESFTRLAGGLTMFAGGALGIRAGWKMPTYWSNVKWDEPVKSAKITAQKVDMETGKVTGVSEGFVTEHGTSSSYWGMVKKDIWIKGFPETGFIGDLKTKMIDAVTWNPSAGVQKVFIGKYQLGESYFYPTGYSESTGFVIDKIGKSVSFSTKEGVGEFGMKLGKGTINFPDFSSTKEIVMGEISQNVVFEGANIKTGYGYSISTPKLIKEITQEIKPPISQTVKVGKGSITTFSFSDSQIKEMLVKSLYEIPSTSYEFEQFKGGEYKFSSMKQLEKAFTVSREPILTSTSGGIGGITITKPPTDLTFGTGGAVFTLHPQILKQFEQTVRITSTSLWKPFYSPMKGITLDQTYIVYPQSEKNEITQNMQNVSRTVQRSVSLQKLNLNLGSNLRSEYKLGLQQQSQSQSQMQHQLQQQLQLQQQQQLQLQTITPRQTIKIVTTGYTPDLRFLKGSSFKISIKTPSGATKSYRISSLIKPTASMYSLERAFGRYGKGSLARGKGIEKVFRELARSSGLALEFPAAEFIRGGKRK